MPAGTVCEQAEADAPKNERSTRGSASSFFDLLRWSLGRLPPDVAADAASAAEFAGTPAMQNVRDQYEGGGCKDHIYEPKQFGPDEFLGTASVTGHLVGGFSASIRSLGNGIVVVKATNTWGRQSMSRWPGANNRGNPSVQELGTALRHMAHGGAVSSLYPRSTHYDVASGSFATTRVNYIWTEGTPCAQ